MMDHKKNKDRGKKKRVYVHQETGSDCRTIALSIGQSACARTIIENALVLIGRKYLHGSEEDIGGEQTESVRKLALSDAKGRVLPMDEPIGHRLARGCDLFICAAESSASDPPRGTSVERPSPPTSSSTGTRAATATSSGAAPASPSPTATADACTPWLDAWSAPDSSCLSNALAIKDVGNGHMRDGRHFEAAQSYERGIELHPLVHVLYGNLSEALLRMRMFGPARVAAHQAVCLEPTSPKYRFRLGKSLLGLGLANDAKAAFARGRRLDIDAGGKGTLFDAWERKCSASEASGASLAGGEERDDSSAALSVEHIHRILCAANAHRSKGNERSAKHLYERILTALPTHLESLFAIGQIWYGAKGFHAAARHFEQCVHLAPHHVPHLLACGKANFHLDRLDRAKECFAQAYHHSGHDEDARTDAEVWMAKVVCATGDPTSAVKVYSEVISRREDHHGALMEYGKAMLAQGHRDEAIRVYLRLLIQSPDDKEVCQMLSQSIAGRGLDYLIAELESTNATSASAYAYIATVVKDWGGMHESARLYKLSLEKDVSCGTYALNLMHVLEVTQEYERALSVCKEFFRANRRTLAIVHRENRLCAHQVCAVLQRIPSKPNVPVPAANGHGTSRAVGHDESALPHVALCVEDTGDAGEPVVFRSGRSTTHGDGGGDYGDDYLDLAGVLFTAVKICFLTRRMRCIRSLIDIIEPIRGSDLHLTSVRNEHAYYCCIKDLIEYGGMEEDASSIEPVYVLGDSHCLSPSWRRIHVKGSALMFVPKLVTGLKMWHLRPQGTFFPKMNFQSVASSVPRGSKVILVCGEIDCREGLLASVEKCRYDSLEHAAATVIGIFIDALSNMYEKYHWEMYVHPVAPVLPQTRSVVHLFNEELRRRVRCAPFLTWLEFVDEMVDDTGPLKQAFHLDGTHLSPAYVPLLEEALSGVM